MPGGDLEHKVAIVTGGGSGIGEACAKLLAQRGASVLVSHIDLAAAERVAGEIESAGGRAVADRAVADRTDVADPDQVEAMVSVAVERFGGLDVGVNNARNRRSHSTHR